MANGIYDHVWEFYTIINGPCINQYIKIFSVCASVCDGCGRGNSLTTATRATAS